MIYLLRFFTLKGVYRNLLSLPLVAMAVGFAGPASSQELLAKPTAPETILAGSARTTIEFDRSWRFSKGDFPSAPMPGFDDSLWKELNLPHDWSIEGPFSPDYASGTGYAPGGIAWYRKRFRIDPGAKEKVVRIEFDGVYNHSAVWINGHFVGGRPYGYSSFECDLTSFLKFGNADNLIAVRVDHSKFADSRWYTGSGIYRHVRLTITDRLRIPQWGVFVRTPEVTTNAAVVRIETTLANETDGIADYILETEALGPDGAVAAVVSTRGSVEPGKQRMAAQRLSILNPQLWNVDAPRLYVLRSRVKAGKVMADQVDTPFGIRTLKFDPDKGFLLNEKHLKLKGVCVHHDAGCLGAAVPRGVWERRLRTLKELGANAIRTSHNPPAPELLDLCDQLGLLVKNEAFDEFTPAKNKWVTGRNKWQPARFGYAESFDEWAVRDIEDLVRRDRNHPSVIMWSIGNEIDYPNDPFTHPVLGDDYRPGNPPARLLPDHARVLIKAVKDLDPTRPVTAALAHAEMSDAVGLGELLDVVGYNYQESRYASDHAKYTDRFLFGSETGHQYRNWVIVRDNDYVAGQYLWTGIDFLGEANSWPNRGSAAGLLDLCGFKKPLAWYRQSLWSDQPMIYLCAEPSPVEGAKAGRSRGVESWNWPPNSVVAVRCFTTCSEVQLMLNDKPAGRKSLSEAEEGVLSWEIPFESGALKAVGYQAGKAVCDFTLRTADNPARIMLLPDTQKLAPNGKDVVHVEFRVVDSKGVLAPDTENEVGFEIEGPAEIMGIENGNLNVPPDYTTKSRKAFRGRGLLILRSSQAGDVLLRATSPGLEPSVLKLNSQ